jgi:predicted polyphosphate/ATP-dependent NAD kinase
MTRVIGLIVNPVAGMGGSVGLKGTDDPEILRRARELGAVPHAADRAAAALEVVARDGVPVTLLTCAGEMGETAALAAGVSPSVVYRPATPDGTTGADTRRAAQAMVEAGAELLVVAGGDGTARDLYEAVGESVPVVAIPAGVKIHSAVFAVNPRAAGDLVVAVLRGRVSRTRMAEVMDVDEDAYRAGRLETRLYGSLLVPVEPRLVQGGKVRSRSEDASADLLAAAVAADLEPGVTYLLGPGTTTRRIARRLGFEGTLLGVDIVRDGRLVAADVGEQRLLEELAAYPGARIVVTPIGGQGYLFGRGNQQLSARVVRAAGIRNVIVVATPDKLAALAGRPLLVDLDDEDLDRALAGYIAVATGPGQRAMYAVAYPRSTDPGERGP